MIITSDAAMTTATLVFAIHVADSCGFSAAAFEWYHSLFPPNE
jgi:hypothetical protein